MELLELLELLELPLLDDELPPLFEDDDDEDDELGDGPPLDELEDELEDEELLEELPGISTLAVADVALHPLP